MCVLCANESFCVEVAVCFFVFLEARAVAVNFDERREIFENKKKSRKTKITAGGVAVEGATRSVFEWLTSLCLSGRVVGKIIKK